MDSDLSLDFLSVVEQAAIACAHTMGQGDGHAADQAAVEAMRKCLDTVAIDGTIVIGEGERDEAPMLYIGEKVGSAAGGAAADRCRRSTSRSIRSKARTCARRAPRTRWPCSPRRTKAACCTRPISTWRSWSSAPRRARVVDLDAPVADNLAAIARSLESPRRRSRHHGARPPAAPGAHRRHPRGRRAHPADSATATWPRALRRRSRDRACTRSWAPAARPKAC